MEKAVIALATPKYGMERQRPTKILVPMSGIEAMIAIGPNTNGVQMKITVIAAKNLRTAFCHPGGEK